MFYLIFILVIVVVLCVVFKIRIKFWTFLKKGFLPIRGDFGLYCYCGKQGKGKTYSCVEYLLDNRDKIAVFCNVAGIKGVDYFHFTGFDELIKLKEIIDYNYSDYADLLSYIKSLGFSDTRSNHILSIYKDFKENKKQLIFVYDEIFTELQKKSQLNKPVLDFLCQMRKRKIIFLTTAQEWAEIPLTFRRFCRYEIDCTMINLLVVGILHKRFRDAENMKWSDEDQEFVAPLVCNTITKARKEVSSAYNTFLRISSVNPNEVAPSTVATSKERKDEIIFGNASNE